MKHWTKYKGHEFNIGGKKKLYDTTIYTFDIETTSYIITPDGVVPAKDYIKISQKYKKSDLKPQATMYIWQFGVNDTVYYGRTWKELFEFLGVLDEATNYYKKFVFVHNLSFEFQFCYHYFNFNKVFARKRRSPMLAIDDIYHLEFRCSLMMSNCSLEYLPDIFGLSVKKQVGSLNYDKLRHSKTKLTKTELKYCEYDCLVLYEYIKYELSIYGTLKKLPRTSTGKVRLELKAAIFRNWPYINRIRRMIDTDPVVFNILVEAFGGGYTHANWIYVDEILKFIISLDACSQYPHVLTTMKYPAKAFSKCNVKSVDDMLDNFLYIMRIRFIHGTSRFNNHFISSNKCRNISGGVYDNGRLEAFESIETTITCVDLKTILKAYGDRDNPDNELQYEILEIYNAPAKYLPKTYIEFILEKYKKKTLLKGVKNKVVEYSKEKNSFNSIYGMTVTNTIRNEVIFENNNWQDDRPLTNEEIVEKLNEQLKQPFLAFSTGVFCTAWARSILMNLIMKNDEYNVYSDTDSLKLKPGYDELSIYEYNQNVYKNIKAVCEYYNLDETLFSPEDIEGNKHTLGLFEFEEEYREFKTLGAKKYAVVHEDGSLEITVSGVPKKNGSKALKSLKEFTDDFVFPAEITNKKIAYYIDEQEPINLTDYRGITYNVDDKTGVCLLPADYTLGKSAEFDTFLSSARARYTE